MPLAFRHQVQWPYACDHTMPINPSLGKLLSVTKAHSHIQQSLASMSPFDNSCNNQPRHKWFSTKCDILPCAEVVPIILQSMLEDSQHYHGWCNTKERKETNKGKLKLWAIYKRYCPAPTCNYNLVYCTPIIQWRLTSWKAHKMWVSNTFDRWSTFLTTAEF